MNRTKDSTKREKVLVTLPEKYINALDNKIDNVLIRTRGDAVISLLSELQKSNPGILKFEEKQKALTAPAWLTPDILNNILAIFKIPENPSETTVRIAIDEIKTKLKISEYVGNDGLRDLRRMRSAAKTSTEAPHTAEPGAP